MKKLGLATGLLLLGGVFWLFLRPATPAPETAAAMKPTIAAAPVSAPVAVRDDGSRVWLKSARGLLEVAGLRPDAARVRILPPGEIPDEVPGPAFAGSAEHDLIIRQMADAVEFRLPELTVIHDNATGLLTFLDGNGRTLFTEQPGSRRFSPLAADGPYYRAAVGFVPNPGEQRLGGDDGLSISNRGYALFWPSVKPAEGKFAFQFPHVKALDFVVISGNPERITAAYRDLSGRIPLPPRDAVDTPVALPAKPLAGYGELHTAAADARTAQPDRRMLLFADAPRPGMQRYPALLLGGEADDFDALLAGQLRLVAAGYPYSTLRHRPFDAAGERARAVLNTFRPVMDGGTLPEDLRTLRARLAPYLYGAAADMTHRNTTAFRPVAFDFPLDPKAWQVRNAFLCGPALLVAPAGGRVYLPQGTDWYEFTSGKHHRGGTTATCDAALPVFVRAGSVLPLAEGKPGAMRLRIYPGADVEYAIYGDDGQSYRYEKGGFSAIPVRWDEKKRTLTLFPRMGRLPAAPLAFLVELPGAPARTADYQGKILEIRFTENVSKRMEKMEKTDKAIEQLNENFKNDAVSFRRGEGNYIYIDVANRFAKATVSLHGAHVTDYTPAGQRPVLWMSAKSDYAPDGAIRGGIPICWPWFGGHPTDATLPAHGYARRCDWSVAEIETMANGATRLVLYLSDDDVPAKYRPRPFDLAYTVTVGDTLECELTMCNMGEEDFPVSAALHSYFNVGAVEQVSVGGLENMTFEDTLTQTFHTESQPVKIDREVDRRYLDNGRRAVLTDPVFGRRIAVEKSNSYSTVVWNPWIDKSKRMPDFGDEEYHTMICIETTNCGKDARIVKPGECYAFACKIMTE